MWQLMNWLNKLLSFAVVFLTSLCNYKIHTLYDLNNVHSSLIVSTIMILLMKIIKQDRWLHFMYIGIFIGMSDYKINFLYINLIISSLIAVLLFFLLANKLNGFGGKLGTIAFVSCLVPYLLSL